MNRKKDKNKNNSKRSSIHNTTTGGNGAGGSALANCVGVRCDVDARMSCSNPYYSKSSVVPDHYCVVVTSTTSANNKAAAGGKKSSKGQNNRPSSKKAMREPSSNTSKNGQLVQHQFQPHHHQQQQQQVVVGGHQQPQLQQLQPVGGRAPSGPPPPPAGPPGPHQGGPQQQGVLNPQQLSLNQLQDMAMRQQNQIEAQQQMLVAKEQRLKYLRQQDFKQNQMAAEYERLRRLREKVEAQEMKLRKLRALRGQGNNVQQQPRPTSTSVSTDLEAIRSLFTEKEKELGLAVRKVDELTHQLDDLRNGRVSNHFPPQMVELERLRRELAYRKQLNEQQNNMISQQRDQLSRGHEEIAKMDNRILELQERLTKKRCMNQQLANQISAATSAKQAQLRAIQQGMMNRNKNKPVSTVEPFQRQAQAQALEANTEDNKNNDPKYQTLPYNTKFGPPSQHPQSQQQQHQPANMAMLKKIEALKQEKENNNSGNGNHDLPSPPPQLPMQRIARPDHLGNYELAKPISSVAPVISDSSFGIGNNSNSESSSSASNGIDTSPTSTTTTSTPSLPPKPTSSSTADRSPSPPPYVPAPPPVSSSNAANSIANHQSNPNDSTITVVKGNNGYSSSSAANNLSVSTHPAEEGTSVDDDMPSASENESEDNSSRGSNLMVRPNVHISINRRIEMPPAFHFPEDGTPPSDLVGVNTQDYPDNAGAGGNFYSYQDFEHLSAEEKYQLFGSSAGNLVGHPDSDRSHRDQDQEQLDEDHEDILDVVPDVVESDIRDHMPPGIIKKPVSSSGSSGDEKESRSRRISFDPLALLLDASLEGELELVKKTAREVPNPSAANDEGITALHNAICAGHYDIVKFLVEFGCDVNAQDSDGWTPLHCAASCNNLEMVRFLVEHGACIFATTLSDRETAAEKCEEEEEGYRGCYDYLCNIQENLGLMNNTEVFAVYDYKAHRSDELDFGVGAKLSVLRRGDDFEKEWWWCKINAERDGYVPRNLLGLYPRVTPLFTLNIPADQQMNEKKTSDEDEDVTMSS